MGNMIFIDTALQGHHDFMKYAFHEPENFFKSIKKKNENTAT